MGFINGIKMLSVSFPLAKPFSNHVRSITHIPGLVVTITTQNGIIGQGFIYGLSHIVPFDIMPHLKNDMIDTLLEETSKIGDAITLASFWRSFWKTYRSRTLSHQQLYALAAMDIAIWDVITKTNHVSLHSFLGGCLSRIPVYGTTGWLSLSTQELIQECEFYRHKSINAFKLRLGHVDDIARVSMIRAAMGDDFQIMVDANQRYSPQQAGEMATALSPFRITWLEEPTDNTLENIAAIKKSSCIPIALGETIIEKQDFEEICKKKLTDYLQLDLPRCGGITGFCDIAKIAMQYNIPLCSHLMYEVSIGLLAAFPNAHMLEYDNLLPAGIFAESLEVHQGHLSPAKVPGNGATLTDAALKQFQTDSYRFGQ